jgi:hypothetical protein
LELQVSLVLLGLALVGVFPLLVMQSRGLVLLERRLPDRAPCYLIPSTDTWARKLGAAAAVVWQDPGAPATPPAREIDDADAGFSAPPANWTVVPTVPGLHGSYRVSPGGAGPSDPATAACWSFAGVNPAWYVVRATWLEGTDRATNARYTIYDGATSLGDFAMNQKAAPAGTAYDERPWENLATLYIHNNTVQVKLGSDGNGVVVADGVRLVPLLNDVQVSSLDRSAAGDEATVHVSINPPLP